MLAYRALMLNPVVNPATSAQIVYEKPIRDLFLTYGTRCHSTATVSAQIPATQKTGFTRRPLGACRTFRRIGFPSARQPSDDLWS
jgi:hypothetical protein